MTYTIQFEDNATREIFRIVVHLVEDVVIS